MLPHEKLNIAQRRDYANSPSQNV